jgi:hypothetical protein
MLNVKIYYNDENDELYCVFDKERIEIGEKYAVLYTQMYDGTVEELVYRLDNLPCENEYESDEEDDPFFGRT